MHSREDPVRLGRADAAVTVLYAAHWAAMVRLAWLLVHDQGVAEEIAQDSFVALHRQWDRLEDEDRAVGYLRRTVVNKARSALRHDKVVRRQHLADIASGRALGSRSEPSAEDRALVSERHDRILALLATLPDRQREVLTLRYYVDLDEAGIAAALGISRGAVKSHAHRGLSALRSATTDGSLR
ncbi:MAG: sigma-70 family RNA polymerase sigma factor [Nostocoides sp.]